MKILEYSSQRGFFSHIFYALIFAVFICIIILYKVINFSWGKSVVYPYTIFITTFMLSRVIGSFFYKSYKEKLKLEDRVKLDMGFVPFVSFIIPCKNEEKVIYRTISKCFDCNYPKNKVEVIAINDGSTDGTLNAMLRTKKDYSDRDIIIINFLKNKGKRRAMAEGFKIAKGEIIIQLDSDSYPEKNSLTHIIAPFIDKNVGATVGHTDPSNKNENLITKMQTAYYFMSFRALKATESIFDMVFCCSGCFSAYRKDYVLPIINKWLDEKFLGKEIIFGDDRALTNWILRQGYKTVYIDEAQAYTVVPNTLKKFLKQQVRWKKGWLINSIKICPFIFKKDKFVSLTYFIPLIIITLLTPFIAFKALVLNPIFFGISPLFYIVGVMIVSVMLFVHYNLYSGEKYGKYMILWSILNMTVLSYIMVYAIYDLRNMSWGTR